MPRITCPECDEVVMVAAGTRSARCPACHHKLIDDGADKRDEEEEEERKPKKKKKSKKRGSRAREPFRGLIPLVLFGPAGLVLAICAPFSSLATALCLVICLPLALLSFVFLWRAYHNEPELVERIREDADERLLGAAIMLDSMFAAFSYPRLIGSWGAITAVSGLMCLMGILGISVFNKLQDGPQQKQPEQKQESAQPGSGGTNQPADKKVDEDALIAKALADLDSKQNTLQWGALEQLTKAKPTDKRRAEVVRRLTVLLDSSDGITRSRAIEALGLWGGPDDALTLIRLLDSPDISTRKDAIIAVRRFRDPRAIPSLIRQMADFDEAQQALVDVGPDAEKDLLQFLGLKADFRFQGPALKVLKEIGTETSVPYLEVLVKEGDSVRASAAQKALTGIESRAKK